MKRYRLKLLAAVWLLASSAGYAQRNDSGQTKPRTITLLAVGDVLLARSVGTRIDRYGTDYPFQHVKHVLQEADVAFANLECPISQHGVRVAKPFSFKAKPKTVRCLTNAGFDVVSLANNHTMDCRRTGLVETMQYLKLKGLRWCGAGRNRAEAEAPTFLDVNGIKLAFVAFCDFLPEGSFLNDDKPTIAFASEESVSSGVAAARQVADIVVASFHWGVEYASHPSSRQRHLAKLAVDSGADLVLGHHPHVLQGLEAVARHSSLVSRHSLIAYSLGNFVFDSRKPRTKESAALRCTLGKQGILKAEVLPMKVRKYRPQPAKAADGKRILRRMAALSSRLGTKVRDGRIALGD